MSEERLARIESRLDGLTATVETLSGTVETLSGTVETLSGTVEKGYAKLEAGLAEVQAGQLTLGHQMRVLYEDALSRIAGSDQAPLIASTRRELVALIDKRHEQVNRRLEPLEQALRRSTRRRRPR